ncbi:MAG: glycosyltransferase family 87 protein [Panacagrimonas sp.]
MKSLGLPQDKGTLERVLLYAAIALLPFALLVVAFDQWPYLSDQLSRGQPLGRDAYNFWTAGQLCLEGRIGDIYDNTAFTAAQKEAIPGIGFNSFLYPPPALPMVAALALLPYPVALLLWSTLGVVAFLAAVAAPRFCRWPVLLALAAPMTAFNLAAGQNGLLSAALLIGGLRLSSTRPVIAGMLFGLLAYKPILGLLIPVLLMVRGHWKTVASAAVTVVLVCLLPVALWGWQAWDLFIVHSLPDQQVTLHRGTGIGMLMIPSAFNSGRLLGLDTTAAYVAHAGFAVLALATFANYLRRTRERREISPWDILILAVATTMVSPYLHNYDFPVVEGALVLCAAAYPGLRMNRIEAGAVAVLWSVSLVSLLTNFVGLPIAPVLILTSLFIVAEKSLAVPAAG